MRGSWIGRAGFVALAVSVLLGLGACSAGPSNSARSTTSSVAPTSPTTTSATTTTAVSATSNLVVTDDIRV